MRRIHYHVSHRLIEGYTRELDIHAEVHAAALSQSHGPARDILDAKVLGSCMHTERHGHMAS